MLLDGAEDGAEDTDGAEDEGTTDGVDEDGTEEG